MIALYVITAMSLTGSCQESAINLVPNAGFEQADGTGPAFWQQRTPSDSERGLDWVKDRPHGGERCLRITNFTDTRSRWRTGHLHDLRLRPATTAELSGWVRHANGDGSAYLRLYFLGPNGEIIEEPSSQQVAGNTSWTRVSLQTTVPPQAAYCMVYCEKDGRGTGWYDDIELRGEPWDGAPRPEPLPPMVYGGDDFDRLQGFQPITWARQRVLAPIAGQPVNLAEIWFAGETACYDITLRYAEKPAGPAEIALKLNGATLIGLQDASAHEPTQTGGFVWIEKTARHVNLQHHSRLQLELRLAEGQQCRIASVMFSVAGRFEGEVLPPHAIKLPPTPFCYPTSLERKSLRAQLRSYISRRFTKLLRRQRAEKLAQLRTPEDWRRTQQETRALLPRILGDFGDKCPLNPHVVGQIERDKYRIEKIIIESHPRYYVPCNFYVPKGRKLPVPGVLFTCGHAADGKGYHLYHECCLGLVLKGYCVLAVEPMGQGERSEYFNPRTGKPTVPLTVAQHHQLLRPSWLVGRSLAGYRTWDLHRAVDYLITRPEVDPERLAVVGNSGGGQMALLIMAFDERLDVCAAAHPGGSCENIYLTGRALFDRRLLSLIAPRPCRFIVGRESGEERGHRAKYEDMLQFYRGLGADEERLSFVLVDGVHDMKRPKREAAYEWLNRWLGKEKEGSTEPPLQPETVQDLWCTDSGLVLTSLHGQSGQTLNAKLAEKIRPKRTPPRSANEARVATQVVRKALLERIGARTGERNHPPRSRYVGEVVWDGVRVRKLLIASEPGIELAAILLCPPQPRSKCLMILHAAQEGKPSSLERSAPPLDLAKLGYYVLSVDVRGVGEADLSPEPPPSPGRGYNATQWLRDTTAINAAYGGTTLLAMRAFDLLRTLDWVRTQERLKDLPVVVFGEGLGGVWAMVAAVLDDRIAVIVCRRTLISYRALVNSQYYEVQGYFWVPGALHDYDLPDLPALLAPRPVLWLDPVDPLLNVVATRRVKTELK